MRLLIVLLLSLGMTTEWGTSFSVRTPNDELKPLDYELSIKLNDTNGKIQYLLKRDWERELGEKYIDDVVNFQHELLPYVYYGVDYVNKESKDINYTTYNIGSTIGWFKAGASFKDIDGEISPLLNLAISKKLKQKDLEYNVGISVKSNIVDYNIVNVKSEIKKWLTEKLNVYGIYKHEYYNEKEDFQFKVGLGVKLWN